MGLKLDSRVLVVFALACGGETDSDASSQVAQSSLCERFCALKEHCGFRVELTPGSSARSYKRSS